MAQVEIRDTFLTITVVYIGTADAMDDHVRALHEALIELRAAVNVNWLRVLPEPTPNLWRYEFRAVDTRRWDQYIRAEPGQAPRMTFNTHGDEWALGEFSAQRNLRDTIVLMLQTGSVVSIDVNWI